MKTRCRNPKTDGYHRYGGRGIKVWEPWERDFWAFAFYVGDKPTPFHSIDRIDVNGDYEPGNVRWATAKEQQAHRVKNKKTKAKSAPATPAPAPLTRDEKGLVLVLSKVTKAQLAQHLGIAKQNLTRWTKVPVRHVPRVSELTGIPRELILPSVYQ